MQRGFLTLLLLNRRHRLKKPRVGFQAQPREWGSAEDAPAGSTASQASPSPAPLFSCPESLPPPTLLKHTNPRCPLALLSALPVANLQCQQGGAVFQPLVLPLQVPFARLHTHCQHWGWSAGRRAALDQAACLHGCQLGLCCPLERSVSPKGEGCRRTCEGQGLTSHPGILGSLNVHRPTGRWNLGVLVPTVLVSQGGFPWSFYMARNAGK